ncbi:MAG: hypothetical protein ACLP7Q_14705 [Isosphaeraceae bacterium]
MSDSSTRYKANQVKVFVTWGSTRQAKRATRARVIIEEIRAGAIIPVAGSPGFYEVGAVTASGRRKFHYAREVTADDAQSDAVSFTWNSPLPEKQLESLKRFYLQLEKVRSAMRVWQQTSAVPPSPGDSADPEGQSELDLTPERVLRELENSVLSNSERGKLVIEAELLEFSEVQAASLTKLLRRFIDDCRESNVPSDLVAVASAIRKFVATASTGEAFDYAASLLRASSRAPPSIELELEVTKMVVRRLTANPPASDQSFPDLAIRLKELCETYLNPRLLARENHGAVALNAVLGLVLTRDHAAIDVIGRVRGLNASWFQKLVGRRASRLKTELGQRCFGDRYQDLLGSLDELSEMVSQKTPT